MKIAFAGTPDFAQAQLEALCRTPHEIVVVYTQPDRPAGRGQHLQASPVKTVALAHRYPIEQPASLKTSHAAATLKQYQPDVLIVAAYGLILPKAILEIPRWGCINVHASLLPRWRGASPIQQAILAGDPITGITLMRMEEGLDSGPMLAQATCPISDQDTSETLHEKLAQLGAQLLVEKLDDIIRQPGSQQDPAQVTHAGKINKEQGHLDWKASATVLARCVRAFDPWPIAFGLLEDQIIRIKAVQVLDQPTIAAPGTIIEHRPQGPVVACGQGALLLIQGQLPGKKFLPFNEILKGHAALFALDQQFN